MTQFFIILAQSVTGAVITIVALLLVAAIIGYFTAWFYAKSVYTPIIKGLEEEKAELQKQVSQLKEEVKKLKDTVKELNEKVEKQTEKIGELSEKNAKLEKEIEEKDKEIKLFSKSQK